MRNPQRLNARRSDLAEVSSKRKSGLHGDMQRSAEMTDPRDEKSRSNKSSEIPCRVSSDLHEWRNDLGTVSATRSANL